ncbi:peptidase [Fannyhessea vaginae]|uniref:peptidase n=1 Tax=Fannyhessea vaginae TaxID=82135 RepID=UPI00288BF7C6|nr:peptidase [Fannyhessea vaginae]
MSNLAPKHSSQKVNHNRFSNHSRLALSARACSAILAGTMLLGGGLTASLAYADGYVGTDGNIYYGYKSDANYSKQRIKIEVHYYNNQQDAEQDNLANQDPLGKFVHVKYIANLNSDDNSFDKWAFRPMWWYGVPAGLTNVHDINYSRFEKYTGNGNPVPSRPGLHREDENVTKHYATAKDWPSISNFYITDPSKLASMNGLKTLLGIDGKQNNGYDKTGNTAGNWADYYDATKGMQGMFIDWESAGKRFYQMTYVAELTDKAWQQRDEHPLRFGAGVYRFAGNWHIATGQTHRAPKIAESLKVKYPSLTPVAKLNALSPTEKNTVKEAITKANQQTPHFMDLLADDGIKIGEEGSATLTFKDKTTLTMPGNLLVVEDKKDNVKFPPVYPTPMGVVDPNALSDKDQKAIIDNFKKANADNDFSKHVDLTGADTFKFDNQTKQMTITYKDESTLAVPYSSLVYQGPKISDWAPFNVPDPIEVENLSNLSQQEQKQVTDAFDRVNADLDIYTAAKKSGATPVTFDSGFKNAIITWADGSKTEVPSWQFLNQKAAPAPAPDPSVPTPAAEKTFIVDVPQTQTVVKFDPFKTTSAEINAGNAKTQLDSLKTVLAKYVKDSATKQKVDGVTVTYSVDKNGVGQVTFSKQGYTSKTYPMGIFFKNSPQSPASKPTTESKTHTDTEDQKNTFTYNVTKIEYDGEKPTAQDATKALKQFVKDNYDNVSEADLSSIVDSVTVKATWIPKTGTHNMGSYDASGSNYGPMMSFNIAGNDFGIKVHGRPWDPDADNGPDWNSSMDMDLFTIKPDELYVKKGGTQHQDNTLADLKKQAKDLLKQRRDTDHLTNNDLARAGVKDAENLNDGTIDNMDEKALRDLIRKLTDATKAEYKYNTDLYEVDNPDTIPDEDFQAAVKKFLHANYDDSNATDTDKIDKLIFNVPNTATLTGKGWTPKAGTSCLELQSDSTTYGITTVSINNDDSASADFKNGDTVLFTISKDKLYKKKVQTPAPTPDALAQMREDAKKLIDKNPYLTPDQKKEFKNKIDNAPDEKTIKQILKEANDKGKENKNNTGDPTIQQTINNNKNGGEDKQKHELEAAQKAAQDIIDKLPHLSDEERNAFKKNVTDATTIDDVNAALDKAKKQSELNGAKEDAKTAAQQLLFLDHGTATGEDAALNKVLGSTSTKDAVLKALEDKIAAQDATVQDITDALAAAQRANGINEQHAKQATIAKLNELAQTLDDAVSKLSDADKEAVKAKVEAAKNAIEAAKTKAQQANKPSDLLDALNSVDTTLKDAQQVVTTKIDAEHKENKKQNDHDADPDAFKKDKEKAKGEIDKIPDLTPDQKQKYKDRIENSTHKGDPEAIVNQAQKHKKIENALDKINNEFKHLNNAQRDAFKKIIEDSDAYDHKHEDGTTSDDIDDALKNASATDKAMERLEKLKVEADKLHASDTYKNGDEDKKKAFDEAATAAGTLLDKVKGDAKGAPEVTNLYNDLLKKMQDLDPSAHGAGIDTDALQHEIDNDATFKPNDQVDPKVPGNTVYKTSSKDKREQFDKALEDAKTALKEAQQAIENAKKPGAAALTPDQETAQQKKVDDALDKLVSAREALDGVDTDPLQAEVDNDGALKDDISYKNASQAKKDAFDKALKDAKDLISQLGDLENTGKQYAGKSQKEKQALVDKALKTLKDAAAALDGVDTKPLQDEVNASGDVKQTDTYTNADKDKKDAYDAALEKAQNLLKELAQPDTDTRTKEQKEQELKTALDELVAAKNALNGQPTLPDNGSDDEGTGTDTGANSKSTPQTSDPLALGQALAALLGSVGMVGAGFAKRSKRKGAKHLNRKH